MEDGFVQCVFSCCFLYPGSGYSPNTSTVMIIEPSPVSMLCKECSQIISIG